MDTNRIRQALIRTYESLDDDGKLELIEMAVEVHKEQVKIEQRVHNCLHFIIFAAITFTTIYLIISKYL